MLCRLIRIASTNASRMVNIVDLDHFRSSLIRITLFLGDGKSLLYLQQGTGRHCTELFIITLPSSWYDLNNAERDGTPNHTCANDLDLHCLQRQGLSEFSRTRVKTNNFPWNPIQKGIRMQEIKIKKVVSKENLAEILFARYVQFLQAFIYWYLNSACLRLIMHVSLAMRKGMWTVNEGTDQAVKWHNLPL